MFLSFVSPTYITELNHLSNVNLYHEFIYHQISFNENVVEKIDIKRSYLNLITEI